jgi:hypothetical protein
MKIFKGILLIAFAALSTVSCKKDDMASKSITGIWEGKWGFDSDEPTYFEKWDIRKGGEIIAYDEDGTKIATGTWSANGINFSMVYTPTGRSYTYSFSGLYHDVVNEIIGTWGETPSIADGGTFEMYKK